MSDMGSYIKCGDCLELIKEVPDESVDMILCDLPYGKTRNKWDVIIPMDKLWNEYKRVTRENSAIVLFSSEPFTSYLVNSNLKMFRYDLIWSKPLGSDFLNANVKPLKSHENILVFYRRKPIYNPQKTNGKPYHKKKNSSSQSSNYDYFKPISVDNKDGKRFPLSVMNYGYDKDKYHPTQKPTPLLEYLIKTYTNEGGVVMDNTMGSGSTCVAAINTGRKYIGFELDENYFNIAKQRIEEAENDLFM